MHICAMLDRDASGTPPRPGVWLAILQLSRAIAATVHAHFPKNLWRASSHHRITELCGTFPHRDHFYNRNTSAVGMLLMDDPTARFGLPLCTGWR